MSFTIYIYPKSVREKCESIADETERENYFEDFNNHPPFTEEQISMIHDHLKLRGYTKASGFSNTYEHQNPYAEARLYESSLAFNARGEGILEVCLTAGEFNYFSPLKNGGFAVHDPQNGGWKD